MSDHNDNSIPFAQSFETYRQNCTPGMVRMLAEQLGVSVESIERIGVGYSFELKAWITPERDENGEVIGLQQRLHSGKKIAIEGSRRGLAYVLNPDFKCKSNYAPGKHNWIRVSHDNPCPLCSRTKWCMVSSENPADPAAVLCGNADGAIAECGSGTYLHIRKPDGDKTRKASSVILCDDSPILVVEGFTDTAAGLDLGFVTIGKPSGSGGLRMLSKMPLSGRIVWVIGENDSGAGAQGMEQTYRTLRKLTKDVIKVMPPKGTKDLRQWLQQGLTREQIEQYVAEHGDTEAKTDVLPSDIASDIAKTWLLKENMIGEYPRIRKHAKQWYEYDDDHYAALDEDVLRGRLYKFLDNKVYQTVSAVGEVKLERYKSSRAKVNDILDAANQWCPVAAEPPTWLDEHEHPDPINLIPFQNGILDVAEYVKGNIVMHPATPALFSLNILPYDFDPNACSDMWDDFLNDIFDGDAERINLLAEWMGYNCVPDVYFEKMMLLHGPPRSGKSTVLEAMREMLGRYQCCEVTFQNLCSSFGYHAMVGKLAAMIGDAKTPRARESDSALEKILQITGGDPVNVARKYRDDLASVKLYSRFTIAMNDLPAFTDHVKALEPRLNILAFQKSYVGREDRGLKHRLCKEASQGKLINFALQGLKRLRERQRFTEPTSSTELADQFRLIATPIYAFLDDCCKVAETVDEQKKLFVPKDMLFLAWRRWCEDNGRTYGLKPQFGQKLAAVPQIVANRVRVEGEREYVYQGVALTEQAKMTYLC